jgi:hypothetical protein
MLFHLSIPADDPARVSSVIAELWGGESFPFPPFPGAFTAMAGDARASSVEVYPRSLALFPAAGMTDVEARQTDASLRHSSYHAAIATPLTEAEVHAIASREGWICKTLCRGGIFHVIEFWVENCFMLEVLTDEMQAEYVSRITIDGWRAMLSTGAPHH